MERELQAQATSIPYLPAQGASQPPTPEQQPGQAKQQAGRQSIMTDMLKDLFQGQVPYWLYFHSCKILVQPRLSNEQFWALNKVQRG